MTQMTIRQFEGAPGVSLRIDGGAMTWQDWMTDSLALMTSTENPAAPSLVLLSFMSGAPLAMTPIDDAVRQTLAQAEGHCLVCDDLGEDLLLEGILVKSEPLDTHGLFYSAIQRQTQGDLEGAVQAYQALVKECPRIPRVNNLLGLCLRLANRIEEAEQAYLREIEVSPYVPDAYCNLGILYAKSDREELGRTMFEKALDRDQFYLNALLQLSRILAAAESSPGRMACSVNLRLMATPSDIPQGQEPFL